MEYSDDLIQELIFREIFWEERIMWLNVKDFGIVPDGVTLNTENLQRAIDKASETAQTLYFPEGKYLTGSLNLKGVSLYLDRGCTIIASGDIKDYPCIGYHHNEMGEVTSLLYCLNNQDIFIGGNGTIDLSGESFVDMSKLVIPPYYTIPLTEEQMSECNHFFEKETRLKQPIFFENVKNLNIENITIINSPCWTLSLSHCENVKISNLTICNRKDITNNDGIHLSACRNVIIDSCNIRTGDDCIAMTCITDWNSWCENITISNCQLSSSSKAILVGYMYSMVRDVTISNCSIKESNWGICIICNDRIGAIKNVAISNMLIDTRIYAGNWWGNGEPLSIICMEQDNGVDSFVRSMRPDREFEVSIENIMVSHMICHGENALGIVGDGQNVKRIMLDHIFYQAKSNKNISLKGRTLDLNPAPYFAEVPEDCFLRIIGVSDVYMEDVVGDPEQSVDRIIETEFDMKYFKRNRN